MSWNLTLCWSLHSKPNKMLVLIFKCICRQLYYQRRARISDSRKQNLLKATEIQVVGSRIGCCSVTGETIFQIPVLLLLVVVVVVVVVVRVRVRQVADACECGNEPSGSVKCGEFLD